MILFCAAIFLVQKERGRAARVSLLGILNGGNKRKPLTEIPTLFYFFFWFLLNSFLWKPWRNCGNWEQKEGFLLEKKKISRKVISYAALVQFYLASTTLYYRTYLAWVITLSQLAWGRAEVMLSIFLLLLKWQSSRNQQKILVFHSYC